MYASLSARPPRSRAPHRWHPGQSSRAGALLFSPASLHEPPPSPRRRLLPEISHVSQRPLILPFHLQVPGPHFSQLFASRGYTPHRPMSPAGGAPCPRVIPRFAIPMFLCILLNSSVLALFFLLESQLNLAHLNRSDYYPTVPSSLLTQCYSRNDYTNILLRSC